MIDHLKVHPPLTGRLGDDAIWAATLQELHRDSAIAARHIHVSVDDSWVTLTGYVREDAQRAHAAEVVARLAGVAGVTNRMTLR